MVNLIIGFVVLAFCAWTDYHYRQTSETVIALGIVACIGDDAWFHRPFIPQLVSIVIMMAIFAYPLWTKMIGLGDAEMAVFISVVVGGFMASAMILLAFILAILFRPWIQHLSPKNMEEQERRMIPLGIFFFTSYFAITSVFLLMK